MSAWSSLSINFAPFQTLLSPLKSILQLLETVEAILEALLDLIRAFLLDLSNPLAAVVALLLAAVRAIINQITGSGFAILLVHPDFSRQDIGAIFQSVSGSYAAFEGKVFNKFYDQSDLFRPQYPLGSSVAMMILYIGVNSPGDLLTQLMSLLNFLKHPVILTGLPAPVELKVSPVLKSGDAVAQFSDMFSSQGYNNQLVLEWRMPSNPGGVNQPGFINAFTSFFNSFRFPNFVVERSTSPTGEAVQVAPKSQTNNDALMVLMTKYNFPTPDGLIDLREENGNVYRNFATKFPVAGASLLQGFATGTYQYLDNDPNLVGGQTYYYRVRAYFGNPSEWLGFSVNTNGQNASSDMTAAMGAASTIGASDLVVYSGSQAFIRYGQGVVMGHPSAITKGYVPMDVDDASGFNPYQAVNDAIQAALLLNFELPPAVQSDSAMVQNQKTGWGTLAAVGGQIGPLKAVYKDSQSLWSNLVFTTTSRRVANQVLGTLATNVALQMTLAKKWNQSVTLADGTSGTLANTITNILGAEGAHYNFLTVASDVLSPAGSSARPGPPVQWKFTGVVGGITAANTTKINSYLALEQNYVNGQPLTGPMPISQISVPTPAGSMDASATVGVSVSERTALADFVHTCVSLTASTSYLSWYSITIGDLVPAFIPFMFDFEQFMLALLKAIKSVVAEIEGIIETLIAKIQQLVNLLETIINLIELLNINISVSLLGVSSTNGSGDSLAQALLQSTNKPSSTPYGLHSGMVLTFGGPGAGFIAAFKALAFIMSAGQL